MDFGGYRRYPPLWRRQQLLAFSHLAHALGARMLIVILNDVIGATNMTTPPHYANISQRIV
jgi:hypothetical protein